MKLEEMAEILDGLAGTLEKFLGKTAVSDFHALSACLRNFSGETVAAFCKFTMQAREGNTRAPRGAGKINGDKVQDLVTRIQHFLDHRREYDFAAIRQIVAEVGKLKLPEVKAIIQGLNFHLTGRTKAALVASLENSLSAIKASAEQSSFSLTGAGT
jgi:hypothetical protein